SRRTPKKRYGPYNMTRRALLALVLFLSALSARADDDFWLNEQRGAAAAAAQLTGVGDPWAAAALRLGGFDRDLWDEPPLFADKVPPLSPRRLSGVRDDKPFLDYQKHAPEELPADVRDESAVYWQAVGYAAKVPAAAFAKAAEPNRHLTFGHLYGEPAKYRGRVVHFEGRLVLLKQLDPPPAVQAKGIAVVYEAWVYLDQPGIHPLCVIVPHKPAGVAVGDNQSV